MATLNHLVTVNFGRGGATLGREKYKHIKEKINVNGRAATGRGLRYCKEILLF
jgi:hypothetical protein